MKTSKTTNPLVVLNSGKFKWEGDLDLFQEFVKDVLKIKGKWTVPRGGCKQIKTNNITIRLYENGSVLLEGPMLEDYRKILEQIAIISSDGEHNMGVGDIESTPSHMPSLQNNYLNKFMANSPLSSLDVSNLSMPQLVESDGSHNNSKTFDDLCPDESTKKIEQRQSCEELSLRDVTRRLDSLTHQFERHQTESSLVLNELINTLEVYKNPNDIDHLVQENTSLKRENKSLKEDLDGYKSVISELNTKLTAAENDKASLLTAIRLLNEDRAFIQPNVNSAHNTKETNQVDQTSNCWRAATSTSINKSSHYHPPCLKNKYSILHIEDEEIPEANVDVAVKEGLEDRQPIGDKSSSRKSAAGRKGGHNKKTKSNTVIVGDSMTKYVKGWEMSSATNRVTAKSFPGASIEDMTDFIKPILRKKPDKIILHIGTNNLRNDEATTVADGITNLAHSIEQQCPDIEIIISAIITRSDDMSASSRVRETNKLVKSMCDQNNWYFIANSNIRITHLNARGLHLNHSGSLLLQNNFKLAIAN